MNNQEANVWAQTYSSVVAVGLTDRTLAKGDPVEVVAWLQKEAQKYADAAVKLFRESSEKFTSRGVAEPA